MDPEDYEFRVDTAALLNEIANCAMPRTMGILKIPINVFRELLVRVSQRSIELNDPELNILMLKLGLYEGNPAEIIEAIKQQRERIKSNEPPTVGVVSP